MEEQRSPVTPPEPLRLRRLVDDGIIGGVAAGVAAYLDLEVAYVRLAFVVLGLLGGLAVPIYAACWLLVPAEGTDRALAEELLGSRQG